MIKIITKSYYKSLLSEIEELKKKLEDRQEAINKTNAYWKKVVRDIKKSKA